MNPLVSIIIVNWNGLRWLEDCFDSVAKQDCKNYEIIFVDNASKDGSVEWVKLNYPNTRIIINKENLGFAGANNVGFQKATGEYVLFLNNDTRVTKTFLTELLVVFQDSTIAGSQSKILLMDRPDTHDSVGAYLTPTGVLYHYGFGKKDTQKYNKQIELYTAKGACMMFVKNVLDEVAIDGNIFDPDYFAYFEESDLCHRIWLAGYRIVYSYKSVIYHKMGATSSNMDNAFIQYHSFKNRLRTYLKNFGSFWIYMYVPIHLIFCYCYLVVLFLQAKWQLAWAIQRAIWWNIVHVYDTMVLREYIQKKIRKVSDVSISSSVFKYPKLGYYTNLLRGVVTE